MWHSAVHPRAAPGRFLICYALGARRGIPGCPDKTGAMVLSSCPKKKWMPRQMSMFFPAVILLPTALAYTIAVVHECPKATPP